MSGNQIKKSLPKRTGKESAKLKRARTAKTREERRAARKAQQAARERVNRKLLEGHEWTTKTQRRKLLETLKAAQ